MWNITLADYQQQAAKTAIYPEEAQVYYPSLGLAGEVGEVCNKVKKILRDNKDIEEVRDDLRAELGDVLWYLAALASDLDLSLQVIAELNLQKLQDRQERGVIQGSGDNR